MAIQEISPGKQTQLQELQEQIAICICQGGSVTIDTIGLQITLRPGIGSTIIPDGCKDEIRNFAASEEQKYAATYQQVRKSITWKQIQELNDIKVPLSLHYIGRFLLRFLGWLLLTALIGGITIGIVDSFSKGTSYWLFWVVIFGAPITSVIIAISSCVTQHQGFRYQGLKDIAVAALVRQTLEEQRKQDKEELEEQEQQKAIQEAFHADLEERRKVNLEKKQLYCNQVKSKIDAYISQGMTAHSAIEAAKRDVPIASDTVFPLSADLIFETYAAEVKQKYDDKQKKQAEWEAWVADLKNKIRYHIRQGKKVSIIYDAANYVYTLSIPGSDPLTLQSTGRTIKAMKLLQEYITVEQEKYDDEVRKAEERRLQKQQAKAKAVKKVNGLHPCEHSTAKVNISKQVLYTRAE